jgi:MTH538 TIR-like domain (DUF1863)
VSFQSTLLFGARPAVPVKRKVFVSYHHGGDQQYYDAFSKHFADTYEVFSDASLERGLNSDNDDYIRFQIRQKNIAGSSCTIVLCGAQTHERKYVDWEIKATLDMSHGLFGVWLPTLPLMGKGTQKPDRLQDNIDSGFAKWVQWKELTGDVLKGTIESAIAAPENLIKNDRAMRQRNG